MPTIQKAQFVIQIDSSGNVLCETTAANGSRRKIDLGFDFLANNPELAAAATERHDELKRAELASLRETRSSNISYVSAQPGMGLEFAKQIWGTTPAEFNRAWKQHQKGLAGNLTSVKPPNEPTRMFAGKKVEKLDPSRQLKLKIAL